MAQEAYNVVKCLKAQSSESLADRQITLNICICKTRSSPRMRQGNVMCFLIECPKKDTFSLRHSCQTCKTWNLTGRKHQRNPHWRTLQKSCPVFRGAVKVIKDKHKDPMPGHRRSERHDNKCNTWSWRKIRPWGKYLYRTSLSQDNWWNLSMNCGLRVRW